MIRKYEEVYIWIVTIATFLLVTLIFFPFATIDASVVVNKDTQFVNKPVYQIIANWDDQKAIDIWKLTKKADYECKGRTLNDYIWGFLTIEMGLSDEAAAGIFGNMMVECGSRSFDLQPYIYSEGGYYYGLCQWNTFGHHSSISGGSVQDQLLYLQASISSEMGEGNYTRFCNASTPECAANIFACWYERCADPYGRQQEAIRAYEHFTT